MSNLQVFWLDSRSQLSLIQQASSRIGQALNVCGEVQTATAPSVLSSASLLAAASRINVHMLGTWAEDCEYPSLSTWPSIHLSTWHLSYPPSISLSLHNCNTAVQGLDNRRVKFQVRDIRVHDRAC